MATAVQTLPARSEVKTEDTWDLSSLFHSDEEWKAAFTEWEQRIPEYEKYVGTLGDSAGSLLDFLKFDQQFDRTAERLGTYCFLKTTEDVSDGKYQEMYARFMNAASRAGQAGSFVRPELMAIPDEKMQQFLQNADVAEFKLMLQRILRYKPHTLSQKEEHLLAMQAEMASTAGNVFRQLNSSELEFGNIEIEEGKTIQLSHASFQTCLNTPKREVREIAFHQYYAEFDAHKNTIAATLNGSVQKDVFDAKVRNYPSALESALFDDNVPKSVYENLIASVRNHFADIEAYYDVRRRAMKLDDLHFYDTYVPILSELKKHHSWDQAIDVVIESLEPLGSDYVAALTGGLRGRWCDRYENKGKQPGAFSCGSFDGDPYILMNYQEDVLDHVFTLTHEAGHSMHSYYSAGHQPYQYYNYTIFVAEVASTFNEQLLSRYLQARASDDKERAYLINREIDAIRGTLIRQTMFAEFEKIIHELVEANEPLTVDRLRSEYRKLLDAYLPGVTIDDDLELECLRIPHFYRAFYVYKYATGISAAIALSERVLNGGDQELADYLTFLKSGCSKFPLDLLRDAGVDLEQPTAVDTALDRFGKLVKELDQLLN